MKQERAVRTRQAILAAACAVFEQRGYEAATITEILKVAGVTKGALYFHFDSKDTLAQGVLGEQDQRITIPPQSTKVQELVDTSLVHAYRVRTNLLVRAGVRLSLDQRIDGLDRSGPFLRWRDATLNLLDAAMEQGELLPHVVTTETADIFVGAFAGLQSLSHTLNGYADLEYRISALQRHLTPSVCVPAVLAVIDFSPERGARIAREIDEAAVAEVA
ncbi:MULTISPECIES: ScbR family autoregulator-binding transcription factor [unclassified Streptomyces]|uniref:ScbR family autoregulator-binding transcription factor n=1 Tax=unclassified Streptomyces TaxID=2593676 RepID=UPI002F91133C